MNQNWMFSKGEAVAVLKSIARRKIVTTGFILGVFTALVTAFFVSPTVSLSLSVFVIMAGVLLELLLLLEKHDAVAQIHYETTAEKFSAIEKMESKLLSRAFHDVDALIQSIESDIYNIIEFEELRDKGLFIQLIKLDLRNLEVRLKDIKERNKLILDTHQQASHTIICKTMREEGIKNFKTIIDARADVQAHELDICFGTELRRLVQEKLVQVDVILLVENTQSDDHASILRRLGSLEKYYASEGCKLVQLDIREFERQCNILVLDEVKKHPEIGIYGDRYVYQGTQSEQDGSFPTGHFLRGKKLVASYLELFERCWKEGKPVAPVVSRASG